MSEIEEKEDWESDQKLNRRQKARQILDDWIKYNDIKKLIKIFFKLSQWREASDKRRIINRERQEEEIRARKDNDYVRIKL